MIKELYTVLDKISKDQNPINHYENSFSTVLKDKSTPYNNLSPTKDIKIYAYSKQGCGHHKVECQDSYSIINDLAPDTHFFAVYDGHGRKGKDASLYVNKYIESSLKKNADSIKNIIDKGHINNFFKEFFKVVDSNLHKSEVDTEHGGSCCNAVFISNGKVYSINVGDSRSVMCRQGADGHVSVIDLSKDQKPARKDERERVLKMGGIIEQKHPYSCLRCWDHEKISGLAITRSFGDIKKKSAGVIPEPEIKKYNLEKGDKFIIVASDGVWDVMSSRDAVNFVLEQLKMGTKEKDIAMELANRVRKKWENAGDVNDPYCDDITVILAFLPEIGERMDEETLPP